MPEPGRAAQRSRTRKSIVEAAARLIARGGMPRLDEVASEAGVSRATAYRYFPGLDALLNEAALDALVPNPAALFERGDAPQDVTARLALVDDILDRACRDQELPLRIMLARSIERPVLAGTGHEALRQNRRVPLVEEALAPVGAKLGARQRKRLAQALAMVLGAEGFIALNDVVGLDEAEARKVRRWAIEALLKAALAEG